MQLSQHIEHIPSLHASFFLAHMLREMCQITFKM